ncbi:type II secretion system protein [Bacillus solitudinis]|uniref:type II secretion system protein n=1 Tax=Bacillus solitudinis TaxID=2014074 RepID=UPI000C23A7CC|nr:type II secretion system protein [Bacillus solitudinis]
MKNEKGITLVELLVSVVILGMVLVPVLTIMSGTSIRTDNQEKSTSNAYIAQDVMEKVRINEGIYKINRNEDDSAQTFCASNVTEACSGFLNIAFETELNLNDVQIVEITAEMYSENASFNEVTVSIRDSVNRIELVTLVKK